MASFSQNTPIDYNEKQEQIKRRRKIAEAQMVAGMQDSPATVSAGGGNVVANWGGAISRAVDNYIGKRDLDRADAEGKQAAIDARAELQREGDEYQRTRSGEAVAMQAPGVSAPEVTTGAMDPGAQIMSKPDKARATARAMISQFGPLQELAKLDRGEDLKGQLTLKDIMTQFPNVKDPATMQRAVDTQDISGLEHAPKYFQHEGKVGAYSLKPGETATLNTYGPVQPATESTPPGQYETGTNKFAGVAGGSQTVGKHAASQVVDAQVKELVKGKEEALGAYKGLSVLSDVKARMASMDPSFFGNTSDFKQFFNSAMVGLGAAPIEGAASAEYIKSQMGQFVMDNLKPFAPVAGEDVKVVKQIVGSSNNPKEVLEALLKWQEGYLLNKIDRHEKFVGGLSGKGNFGDLSSFSTKNESSSNPLDRQGPVPDTTDQSLWANRPEANAPPPPTAPGVQPVPAPSAAPPPGTQPAPTPTQVTKGAQKGGRRWNPKTRQFENF